MDATALRAQRLRAHLLAAPAASPLDAARHMRAVQAQDFGAGRWALGVRTAGDPTVRDVDALFDDGSLVRSWTQRGTLHIVPADGVAGILAVTGARQLRATGMDAAFLDRAEGAVRAELAGGGRLTRAEFAAVLAGAGVSDSAPASTRILAALSMRAAVALGPVVPTEAAVTRDQFVVELPPVPPPVDPPSALFVDYLRGHGPATPADFAWWAGVPLGTARAAADAAADRVEEVEDGVFGLAGRDAASRSAPVTAALPAFDEYVLSYADRAPILGAGDRTTVGPLANGMVRPVVVRGGAVVGTWAFGAGARARGGAPSATLFAGESDAGVAAALERHRRFVAGGA